ncbi:MAG: hypothetical protein V4649_19355 [Bacteroidota bacterium]
MAITAKTFVQASTIKQLETDIAAAIVAGKAPSGDVFVDPESGLLTQAVTTGTAEGTVAEAQADIVALETSVTNLNAWATALATKLNADPGVTDANYDTNPQA